MLLSYHLLMIIFYKYTTYKISLFKLYYVRRNLIKTRTYVIGCYGSGGVTRDKLELHVNFSKQVFIFGFKTRARGFVKGKGQKLSILEYLGTAVTPCYFKILVEVAGRCQSHKATGYNKTNKYLIISHFKDSTWKLQTTLVFNEEQ